MVNINHPLLTMMNNNNNWIVVEAKIRLKTTAEGGRLTGIKSGYRPNHAFEQPKEIKNLHTYIGMIEFEGKEIIELGETKTVKVRFLKNPVVEEFVEVGKKWFIYEGARLVGEGEITNV